MTIHIIIWFVGLSEPTNQLQSLAKVHVQAALKKIIKAYDISFNLLEFNNHVIKDQPITYLYSLDESDASKQKSLL